MASRFPSSRFPATSTAPTAVLADTRTEVSPAVSLLDQSPTVSPGQGFSLRLGIASTVPRGAVLTATVFPHVTSRSALAQVFADNDLGPPISSSTAIAVSSLPVDPSGGVDLTVGLITGDSPTPTTPGAPFTADLHCALGECGGVYPVRLELSSRGVPVAGPPLVTTLVYTDPPTNTERLQVAWVVPIALPTDAPTSTGRVPAPSARVLGKLAVLVDALDGHPDVAATVVPDPATVLALADQPRPRSRQLLDGIVALGQLSNHETLAGPFVPVDAAGLVGAGLSGELTSQIVRGSGALVDGGVRAVAGTWVSTGPIDDATLAQLASLGVDHVVLPPTSLSGGFFHLTPAQPLSATTSAGTTVDVALEDPTLAGHFADASGPESVLAANQMLADLALIYYEEPNLPTARAVVALSPTLWSPGSAFLDTLLSGLSANPVLEPVTLASLYDDVPGGGGAHLRRSVPDTAATLPATAIRSTRARVSAFATAASDPSVVRRLGDMLLTSESDLLRPAGQASGVAGTSAALDAQLGMVSITSATIRLTSTTARVPITITNAAPYAVDALMVLSSDELAFPAGNVRSVILDRATNAVYVDMKARTSGVFRVTVTLLSPHGNLVLADRQLTVRSMSTSAVALGLSIGAVVVLLVWWIRTARRRPRPRRGAHARRRRADHDDPTPAASTAGSVPGARGGTSGGETGGTG